MSCDPLIPVPFGPGYLWLTAEEVARAAARSPVGASLGSQGSAGSGAPPWDEPLLTSQQLADKTGVPDTWWEQAAREKRVPFLRAGKYLRFRLTDVLAALRPGADTADTD